MDNRKIYGICIDTETTNGIVDADGKLDLSNSLFFDVGFQVIDSHGRTYGKTYSFINSDIFVDEPELMQEAFFADKIPQYKADLQNGTRTLATTTEIQKILCEVIAEYGCQFIVAHNAYFDYRALNNALRWVTKSKQRYFVPKSVEWWDTLKMARSVMSKMPTYKAFCQKHGYTTKNGQLRFTAEICYRFISNNLDFVESHTGLEDVKIETEILRYCHRQHKPMNRTLWA